MKDNEIGVIEDVCGQLNDVEGEWQKLVEECIGRLLKLIEEPKDQVDDLILENKRLKKLAYDLQNEIELEQLSEARG